VVIQLQTFLIRNAARAGVVRAAGGVAAYEAAAGQSRLPRQGQAMAVAARYWPKPRAGGQGRTRRRTRAFGSHCLKIAGTRTDSDGSERAGG
jgi:hypothetical protein